jgi:error-prone DNA polymerase
VPEQPPAKPRPHPAASQGAPSARPPRLRATPGYVDLEVTSNFTFLTGASHPEELVERAADLGHAAASVTDRNSLAGIVRAHVAAKAAGIPLLVGCRLEVSPGPAPARDARPGPPAPGTVELLVYPTDLASYGRLCRLLTLGKRRAEKGRCRLFLADLPEHAVGLLAVSVPPRALDRRYARTLRDLRATFGDDRLSVATSCLYGPDDRARLGAVLSLAADAGVPLVATNDVHYHDPSRRPLQDVLACVRHGCTVEDAGLRLFAHAERRTKPSEEMARLFAAHPEALRRTVEVADRARAFSLDEVRYRYPDEVSPRGVPPLRHLVDLTWAGAAERYPAGVPPEVRSRLEHEFALVEELGYAPYFLTVHDLVVFARSRGILCQGRGAAANSAVCYCLGITALDPTRIDLLFERFVSRERAEPPDIDVDFEHERREEVIQHLYAKYGRDRAALVAEVVSYRGRSAVRDVGKAMGLSLDAVDRLAKSVDRWGGEGPALAEEGFDPGDPVLVRVAALCAEVEGFPRHLSQHVGGFVFARDRLCDLVPIENASMPDRTVIEWDKDDVDAMGMLKVDVLGLGMLTCVRKAFDHAARVRAPGEDAPARPASFSLHTIPPEDPEVYEMISRADTVGVFQVESRAQMSMLPRLRPRCFYDLVIEVAIVRPGPIQGGMVHPYLRRRSGEEPVTYPSPEVRRVLERTLGVPLFQEQAMSLAIVAAGFEPGEAERLRRAMAAWKRKSGDIERLGRRLVEGMVERGYPREFADRCFAQIQGFSEYGFPESHAASFALLVYVSAWLKHRHPAAFAAGLLDSQPMGFYAPAQIVRDAREHGVLVRPVDVLRSGWDCRLEPSSGGGGPALRLGMRLVSGLRRADADAVDRAVSRERSFPTVGALHRASGASAASLRRLASADAFGSMGLDRRAALWQVRALRDERLPLFEASEDARGSGEPEATLPQTTPAAKVLDDYRTLSLSLDGHPVGFLRDRLRAEGVSTAAEVADEARTPNGRRISVAGLVLVRQRPATASGVVFLTVEDETGPANLIVRPAVYERHRAAAGRSLLVVARGAVERQGRVVHLQVESIEGRDEWVADLSARSRDFR